MRESVKYMYIYVVQVFSIQSGPEKIAQSFKYRHFETVCSRLARFTPKCSVKISVYRSMQNLYQLVKYFFIKARIGYMS